MERNHYLNRNKEQYDWDDSLKGDNLLMENDNIAIAPFLDFPAEMLGVPRIDSEPGPVINDNDGCDN